MEITTLPDFYNQIRPSADGGPGYSLPVPIARELGHFNVFDTAELFGNYKGKPAMPYNRRAYYKISLIEGHNRAEYADKVIEIERQGLLFATPKVPYHYVPQDLSQGGHFCIFTEEFLLSGTSITTLDDLPIFKAGGYPVFQISDVEREEISAIFNKMHKELASDYVFKYDLLRNYLMELIHYGQKLQPASLLDTASNASARVASLFIELLERQFPIESPRQKLRLRSAKDFAGQLAIHVNYLNKVLKESMGSTTTALISSRIIREAKIMLKQTDWNVSEIAWCLGFEEVAHFSNFFRKQTNVSPMSFRA